jgi:hypothetical protein
MSTTRRQFRQRWPASANDASSLARSGRARHGGRARGARSPLVRFPLYDAGGGVCERICRLSRTAARKDIDAVIVATPDHWHAQASIDAMNAGKDVYCEKPMVHSIEEGHAVIAAQRTTGRIIQVGSQRVSSIIYRKAKELIRDGAIGKLNLIEAWWERPVDSDELVFRNSIPPDASSATIDWDRFVANTTRRPFDAQRFFWWHNYRDYGTGIPGDLFVHLFSGVALRARLGRTGADDGHRRHALLE